MDDAELDEWFNEEREKLETVLFEALLNNKNAEQARLVFDKKYRKLIAQLQKKQDQNYDHARRMVKIQKPIDKIKAIFENTTTTISIWWTKVREAVRRWFFERKIKRILRDKSDR